MCTAWVEAVHTGTQAAGPALTPSSPHQLPLCGRRRVPLGFLDPLGMAEKLAEFSHGLKAESPRQVWAGPYFALRPRESLFPCLFHLWRPWLPGWGGTTQALPVPQALRPVLLLVSLKGTRLSAPRDRAWGDARRLHPQDPQLRLQTLSPPMTLGSSGCHEMAPRTVFTAGALGVL